MVALTVFVALQCDVGHNDDSICKITSFIFCFLLINKVASGK